MSTTTWDALKKRLDSIKLPTETFTICEDPDLRQRYNQAKKAARTANDRLAALPADADPELKASLEKNAKKAADELAAAQQAFDKVAVTLRFTALERKRLEELQTQHPPTETDEANGDEYAMATFAPALIAAASLDGMPADYARHCLDTWSAADARGLWMAAWSIQHTQRTDLGKG